MSSLFSYFLLFLALCLSFSCLITATPTPSSSITSSTSSSTSSTSGDDDLCPAGSYINSQGDCILCPSGHRCPISSSSFSVPLLCPAGTYASGVGNVDCTPCSPGTYQPTTGAVGCFPCTSSTTSTEGATECQCIGLNRVFQPSDKSCICKPGYRHLIQTQLAQPLDVSDQDHIVDCQPIQYERCRLGQLSLIHI